MIYITCGTCGTSKGYKTKADGAISLPAAEEKRLVLRGVAAYVTKPIIGATAPPAAAQEGAEVGQGGIAPPNGEKGADGPENAGDGEMLTGHLDAAELETWKKADLEKLAEEMGVDISKARNNTERAAILAAVEVQAPADGDDDGEAPPDLGAADIVS